MKCGLHYVRFCDLRTKRYTGAPACQAATKAIADALARGPLTRRKVHAFAKHPSGSRPGAPGARLPSDRLVLDHNVPKPPSPAAPQVQAEAPSGSERRPQEEDPNARHPSAGAPARAEQAAAPEAEEPSGHGPTGPPHSAQDDAHGGPKPEAGDPIPGVLQEQQGLGGAHTCNEDGRPRDTRALLGLGPGSAHPRCLPGAVVKAGKAGKPAKSKAKQAPGGPASQRARKSASLQEPSGNPKGHIQHWLARGVTDVATAPDGTRGSPGKPHGQAPETCRSMSDCGTGVQPASWRPPAVPGSSTDPPPSGLRPGTGDRSSPTPGGQGAGQGGPQAARRAHPDCGRGSQEHQGGRRWSPPREAEFGLGAGTTSDGEGTPPRVRFVRFIPDLFVPFPGGGRRQVLPRPGGKGAGQLEPD